MTNANKEIITDNLYSYLDKYVSKYELDNACRNMDIGFDDNNTLNPELLDEAITDARNFLNNITKDPFAENADAIYNNAINFALNDIQKQITDSYI